MSPNHLASPDIFAVIGDARRRRILELLAVSERSVGALTTELGIAQPSVTQHLTALRDAGLVTSVKRGTSSIYSLNAAPLAEVTEWVAGLSRAAQPATGDNQ
jgi:DNA-binding transcriptional ArsR family regulator